MGSTRRPSWIDGRTVSEWERLGLLRFPRPGPRLRRYPLSEQRAMRAIDSIRRLGGVSPDRSMTSGGPAELRARRALQPAAAEAARTNPPGTIVELPSKSPHVRHVLVVPEA